MTLLLEPASGCRLVREYAQQLFLTRDLRAQATRLAPQPHLEVLGVEVIINGCVVRPCAGLECLQFAAQSLELT